LICWIKPFTFFAHAMPNSTTFPQAFQITQGHLPLLISIPHLGTRIPPALAAQMTPEAVRLVDTDWHLDQLYDFAAAMGASIIQATYSRYVIDLNRPPTGESLYPGQTTTGLCPNETFRGEPLYLAGCEPDAAEIARRRELYWQPYHDALAAELKRLQQLHGQVLLWDAHSIASMLPRLFEGKLPDLNFGTVGGASCGPRVLQAVLQCLEGEPFTQVVNGRFKGGYITRHYGRPSPGIHAIQLELCQCLYMNEAEPFDYRPDVAQKLQPALQRMLLAAVSTLPARS
jgi:N-formylglutamate deformylase